MDSKVGATPGHGKEVNAGVVKYVLQIPDFIIHLESTSRPYTAEQADQAPLLFVVTHDPSSAFSFHVFPLRLSAAVADVGRSQEYQQAIQRQ